MQKNESPKTILHVEDNPGDVFLVRRMFLKCGITDPIQVARDGEEAFAYLCGLDEFSDREKFPWPSFVITDLKMPKVNGLELLKYLRNLPECRGLPVFVLTSSGFDKDMSEAVRLGANGFFFKPIKVEELEDIVKAIYEQAAIVRQSFFAANHADRGIESVPL